MTPTVAITGGFGFLGWHTAARLRAVSGIETVRLGRADCADVANLAERLVGVEAVLNIAGINRAESEEAVEQGNAAIGATLAQAVRSNGRPMHVVNANSVQIYGDSAYGRGKAVAAELVRAAVLDVGGTFVDVVLPNLFGEHGRPAYNSFVATFCEEITQGRRPLVSNDRAIPLLHAQDAARALIVGLEKRADAKIEPEGEPRLISEVRDLLDSFHALYAQRGEIPDLSTKFATDLFNTYRSYLFPKQFPIYPQAHTDPRGSLYETGRMHGGVGQSYVSITAPGKVRGEHYHLRKVERFFVVKGSAEIQLRRLLHDEVLSFEVSGEKPAFIDMPTMWVHNIRNVGSDELITMFWSDQLLDPGHPDQYTEMVGVS